MAARETPKRHRRVRAANAASATNASVDGAAADDKYEYEYYDGDTPKVATGTTMTSLSARKTTNLPKMVKVKEPEVLKRGIIRDVRPRPSDFRSECSCVSLNSRPIHNSLVYLCLKCHLSVM